MTKKVGVLALVTLAWPSLGKGQTDAFGVTVSSSKSTAITWGLGGCAAGALGGGVSSALGRRSDPEVDVLKNVGVFGVLGCATGLLVGQLLGDDSREQENARRINELRERIEAANIRLAAAGLARSATGGGSGSVVSASAVPGTDPGAFQLTSKRSVALWGAGGCSAGLIAGAAIGGFGKRADPEVDVLKNIGVYGLGGCTLGLLGAAIFADNENEKQMPARIASLATTLGSLEERMRRMGLAVGTAASTPSSEIPRGKGVALKGLVSAYGGNSVSFESLQKAPHQGQVRALRPDVKRFFIGQPGLSEEEVLRRAFIPISPRLAIKPIEVEFSNLDIYEPHEEFGYLQDHYPWLPCFLTRALADLKEKRELAPPSCGGEDTPPVSPKVTPKVLDVFGLMEVPMKSLLGTKKRRAETSNTAIAAFILGGTLESVASGAGTRGPGASLPALVPVSSWASITPIEGQVADQDFFGPDPDTGYLGERYPWLECVLLDSITQKAKEGKNIDVAFEQCQ